MKIPVGFKLSKPFSATVRDSRTAISQTADLFTGGLVISSEREHDGRREVYAQTLVQIDGDVLTAFGKGVIGGPAFERLSRQHFEAVALRLKPLARLPALVRILFWTGIGGGPAILCATRALPVEQLIGTLLTWGGAGTFSIGAAVFGIAGRKLFRLAVCRGINRLTDVAVKETESNEGKGPPH